MTDALSDLLSHRDWLLADGATGTNLFNMGLEAGDAPEFWNADRPDAVRALYRGAVDAGSDIFLTNSFGATPRGSSCTMPQDRARELSRLAAEIGREVADAAGREVIVAGSVGPTGEIMAADGHAVPRARAVEMFHETGRGAEGRRRRRALARDDLGPRGIPGGGRGLRAGGHAMVRHDELRHRRAHDDGPDVAGHGGSGRGRCRTRRWPSAPIAASARRICCGRCSASRRMAPQRPIIAKGNAGIPKFVDGHIHYDGTPDADGGLCGSGARRRRADHRRAAAERHPSICARCARRWRDRSAAPVPHSTRLRHGSGPFPPSMTVPARSQRPLGRATAVAGADPTRKGPPGTPGGPLQFRSRRGDMNRPAGLRSDQRNVKSS